MMLIDPLKHVNKKVDVIKLNNRMDKIVNEIIEYLIEEYSNVIGTSGFENKNADAVKNIIREKINKDYNYNNFDTEDLVNVVFNKLFGYGILEKYITDKEISDIRAVKWNSVYIMRKGKWEKVEDRFANEIDFYNFVRYCVLKNNGRITYEQPIVVVSDKERHLRIEAGISPVNIISPSLVIRIHRPEENLSLEELYYKYNMLDENMYKYLCNAIADGHNIVIAGKGGSGKTTLLRAILNKIPDNVSITSNEETAELYSKHGNIIQREIVKNRNKGNILLEDLTRQSLVMSNDAIVIGEIKGAEAMAFFDGISTGHIGYATVHADSSALVMDRLVTLIKKDVLAQQYSDKYLKNLLAQSLDIIIYMKNFKIYEICTVEYIKENEINCSLIFRYDENLKKFIN
ncbi:MAG: CpaF family protein [Clostridiales bacterium]|nr:CpaF family protein [Clostridiales bacterium]